VGKAEGWIVGLPVGVKDGIVDGPGLALGAVDRAALVSTLGGKSMVTKDLVWELT
jgi:hypothetical protein